jgi:hypothetical protein
MVWASIPPRCRLVIRLHDHRPLAHVADGAFRRDLVDGPRTNAGKLASAEREAIWNFVSGSTGTSLVNVA